jgi:hypothetical protein
MTEDDTFKRLCKCTYEELYARIMHHYSNTSLSGGFITYNDIIDEAGWNIAEYQSEWIRRNTPR